MKKSIITTVKFVLFFIGWALCASIFEIPPNYPAIWRFGAELIPLLSIVLFSIIFWFIEKRNISIVPIGEPVKNLGIGICIGVVWLGITIGILYFADNISWNFTYIRWYV